MKARTLYLLRHGETGATGKYIGSTNIGVAESGFAQLAISRDILRQAGITRILCSPMKRCIESLRFLDLGASVEINEDLREIDFGHWEGQTFGQISKKWPEEVGRWSVWSEDFTFPGGERIGDFLRRMDRVRSRIEQDPDEHMLVVTHGGVIRHLLCSFLGLPPHNYLLFDVRAGQVSTLRLYSEGGVLTSLNQGGTK